MTNEISFDSCNSTGGFEPIWEPSPRDEFFPNSAPREQNLSTIRSSNRKLRGSLLDFSKIRRENDLRKYQNSIPTPCTSASSSVHIDDISEDLKRYFFDKMKKKGIQNAKQVYDQYLQIGFSQKAAIALTDRNFFPKPHEKDHGIYFKKVIGEELFKKEQAARKGKDDWIVRTNSAAIETLEASAAYLKASPDNARQYKSQNSGSIGGYLLGIVEIIAGGALIAVGTGLEVVTVGGFTIGFVPTVGTGVTLIGAGLAKTTANAKDISWDQLNPFVSWKTSDVYAPDRPLPRDPHGHPKPETDAPHTQLGKEKGRRENYPQAREFDGDGKWVRDIDFTDHGRPHDHEICPHQHEYKPNPTGGTPKREVVGKPLPHWDYQ